MAASSGYGRPGAACTLCGGRNAESAVAVCLGSSYLVAVLPRAPWPREGLLKAAGDDPQSLTLAISAYLNFNRRLRFPLIHLADESARRGKRGRLSHLFG